MKTKRFLLLKVLTGFLTLGMNPSLKAQQSISETFTSDGISRGYIGSVPNSPQNPLRLVILFSGTTENMYEMPQRGYDSLVGTNSMVVYPDALNRMEGFNGTDTVDDFLMVEDLIRDVQSKYTIDTSDICIGGFSSGAAFCYNLVCDFNSPSSNRAYSFRAMAAVAGAVGSDILNSNLCPMPKGLPLIAFHGTNDQIASYNGGDSLPNGDVSLSIDTAMQYWATQVNGCSPNYTTTALPDLVAESNPSTAEFREYACGGGARTHLYRIINGFHTWPGGNAQIDFFGFTNRDINASQLIADFFNNSANLSFGENLLEENSFELFPNPVMDHFSVRSEFPIEKVELYNTSGAVVWESNSDFNLINLQFLPSGLYLVKVYTTEGLGVKRIIKQ